MFKICISVIECDTLPGNYYNTIINSPNGTFFGSKAEITCPEGYTIEGQNMLTCLSTGQWSHSIPRCNKIESSTPLSPSPSPTSYRPRGTTRRPTKAPTTTTGRPSSTPVVEINGDSGSEEEEEDVSFTLPGTVREEFPPKSKNRPVIIPQKPAVTQSIPTRPPTTPAKVKPFSPSTTPEITTSNTHNIILNAHPQDNEIQGSVNIRQDRPPNADLPYSVDEDNSNSHTPKLSFHAMMALGGLGGFIFLAAVITVVVVLVRR